MDGYKMLYASWGHKSNAIMCMLEAWKQNATTANYETELQDHAWLLVLMHGFYVYSLGQRNPFCQCTLLQFKLRALPCRAVPASCTKHTVERDGTMDEGCSCSSLFSVLCLQPHLRMKWLSVSECFSPPAFHVHKHTHTPAPLIYNDLSLKCSRPTIYLQLQVWQMG